MSKKIKLTESQLLTLMKNRKKEKLVEEPTIVNESKNESIVEEPVVVNENIEKIKSEFKRFL